MTNFRLMRDHGPKLDQCLSASVEALDLRAILKDLTVIAWGEFGRTPRINGGAGRDHWPQVSCAFLAGGGIRAGQAIGATNRLGEYAKDRPVPVQEIVATSYHNLGIDVARTTITDQPAGPSTSSNHHRCPSRSERFAGDGCCGPGFRWFGRSQHLAAR